MSYFGITSAKNYASFFSQFICLFHSWNSVQVSVDGVPEGDSSARELYYICVAFPPCRRPYPLRIICRYIPYKVTVDDILEPFLEELKTCDMDMEWMLGDTVVRKQLRGMSRGGYYDCDCCLAPGVQYTGGKAGATNAVFPANTAHCKLRTKESDMADALNFMNGPKTMVREDGKRVKISHVHGMQRLTPLHKFKPKRGSLDIHWDILLDTLHLTKLGLAKRMHKWSFVKVQPKTTQKVLDDVQDRMTHIAHATRLPSEFPRRPRNFNMHAKFKASEWGFVMYYFFTICAKFSKEW